MNGCEIEKLCDPPSLFVGTQSFGMAEGLDLERIAQKRGKVKGNGG